MHIKWSKLFTDMLFINMDGLFTFLSTHYKHNDSVRPFTKGIKSYEYIVFDINLIILLFKLNSGNTNDIELSIRSLNYSNTELDMHAIASSVIHRETGSVHINSAFHTEEIANILWKIIFTVWYYDNQRQHKPHTDKSPIYGEILYSKEIEINTINTINST